jgi:predicted RNase H-like HicB family nuclease
MRKLDLLIALPYASEVVPSVTTNGEPCYVARHPELPGCESHGATWFEAMHNLDGARALYIESLLQDGIDPPLPRAVREGGNLPTVMVWEAFSTADEFHAAGDVIRRAFTPPVLQPVGVTVPNVTQ